MPVSPKKPIQAGVKALSVASAPRLSQVGTDPEPAMLRAAAKTRSHVPSGTFRRQAVSAVVDLGAMTHRQNKDDELIIMDLVDDAIVASSDPPLAGTTNETGCGRWTRILSETLAS